MSEEDTCFVVSPIGEKGSEVRERADKLFEYVIEPAVESYGYNPVRADDIDEPGMITSQILTKIVQSPLVIADLTGSNANVFYELAVRHAYQKPVIQLIKEDESIPFDVASTRTIHIDINDLESAEEAKSAIQDQVESIDQDDFDFDTPLSLSLDLKNLKESSDPEERSLGEMMETLSDLRNMMVSMEEKMDRPEELLPPDYFRHVSNEISNGNKEKRERLIDDIENLALQIVDDLRDHDEELAEEYLPQIQYHTDMIRKHNSAESEGVEARYFD